MAIHIVARNDDPDGWPIRYVVRLTSDVTKRELSAWAADLSSSVSVKIESAAKGLSSTEIRDVVAPHVESVQIRIATDDA